MKNNKHRERKSKKLEREMEPMYYGAPPPIPTPQKRFEERKSFRFRSTARLHSCK